MNNVEISLCIIARDESDCIAKCIQSVLPIVSEVIVVDTGSVDNTKDIVLSVYPEAKIISIPWPNDFAKARNISLSYATCPWILVLDADEVIAKSDLKAIKLLVAQDRHPMYMLIQTTYQDASAIIDWEPNHLNEPESYGYPGYFESALTRLFKRSTDIQFHGVVHEHATHRLDHIQPIKAHVRIHHYGKYISHARNQKKEERYLNLGYIKCDQDPKNMMAHYELAVQLWSLGYLDKAMEKIKHCLHINPNYINALLAGANIAIKQYQYADALSYFMRVLDIDSSNKNVYQYLPSVLLEMNDLALAGKVLKQAFQICGQLPPLLVNQAVLCLRKNRFFDAIMYCNDALKINSNEALAHFNMGLAYFHIDDMIAAKAAFIKSESYMETEIMAARKLGEIALKEYDWEMALTKLEYVMQKKEMDDDLLLHCTIASIKSNKNDKAIQYCQQINGALFTNKQQHDAYQWCQQQLIELKEQSHDRTNEIS